MTFSKSRCVIALAALLCSGSAAAQPGHPMVVMAVAAPGGKAQEIATRESGLATLTVKGTEYGFRPTIQDSKPWTRVTVAIFKMTSQIDSLGEVEVTTGGPAASSKTNPTFSIAVVKVYEKP